MRVSARNAGGMRVTSSFIRYIFRGPLTGRLGGATVARLTPDQKVAGSNPVRVSFCSFFLYFFCSPYNL